MHKIKSFVLASAVLLVRYLICTKLNPPSLLYFKKNIILDYASEIFCISTVPSLLLVISKPSSLSPPRHFQTKLPLSSPLFHFLSHSCTSVHPDEGKIVLWGHHPLPLKNRWCQKIAEKIFFLRYSELVRKFGISLFDTMTLTPLRGKVMRKKSNYY